MGTTVKSEYAIAFSWIAAGFVACGVAGNAQDNPGVVRITPADIHWQDVPNGHGVQQAILFGNPDKSGMYVVRVSFPRTSWMFPIGILTLGT
jgi:hypothetical protein